MNPLDQLRDIHLPSTVDWWPVAIGWWMLAIITLLLLVYLIWYFKRRKAQQHTMNLALQSLAELESESTMDSHRWLQSLSALLRQIAINLSGRQEVAGLVGDQWLMYLDKNNKQQAFTQGAGRVLATDPYKADASYDRQALIQLARKWVKTAARKGTKHA